jgi:TolB protein
MNTNAPYFFISYSREDADLQRRIIAELRGRGINVWVDIENLIPGSPAWEREIERSIRGAAGVIVLLSPDSNNSEWVRRESSFAEQNDKRVFPVLIRGDEDDSIPLRLSNHQRVDLRRNFHRGLDELAGALRDHLGVTVVHRQIKQTSGPALQVNPAELKKYGLPVLIALIGVACVGGLALAARFIYTNLNPVPTQIAITTPPDIDPALTPTLANININEGMAGKIVYTCQVDKVNTSDQICVIDADGSGQRQLTNSYDNQDASFSPDGTILFISNRTGNYEIYEMDLSGHATQLTHLGSRVSLPDVSPDNKQIAFTNRVNGDDQLWLMDRDGKNAHVLFKSDGNDAVAPTWSPEGDRILFAVGKEGTKQLFIMGFDGSDPQLLSSQIYTPGRTDWSRQGLIGYFVGDGWSREVWTIYPDGSGMTQVTDGGNSQGPSFSSGGRYITYTAYTRVQQQDVFSCEIFVMDLYTAEKRQLTDNDYCDYQPRWGS